MNIYIDVRHLDFWWGFYGFCSKTSWEDMIIYRKLGRGYKKLAWTCICTNPYFENCLEDLKSDPDEKEFVQKVLEFLESKQIRYHYYYDKSNDTDFYEVPFEAQKNHNNVKPRSIETWYPSKGIDKDVLDICARAFCKKFLNIEVDKVEFKEYISMEDALNAYLEEMKLWKQNPKIGFSNSLMEQLANLWNIPKEKVLNVLNRSIK